jgi:ABC-type antimicrobial peptide transport system permease subunit
MLRTIRLEIAALDPDVPISEDRPLTEWLDYAFQPVRLAGTVLTCFGALGLVLSAIGLYGVLAFRVARQRREIAIRMALGADAGRVGRSIVRRGGVLAVFGAGLGTAGALASARLAAGLLYGVPPNDPATLVAVIGLLSGVALLACYLPARRAARIDPAVALRSD